MTKVNIVEQGCGTVASADNGWTLELPVADSKAYSNAMVTSYRSRQDFTFMPHTRLELTAYAEGDLRGTAGFGFWNHPYGLGVRLPRAVWLFFSSPPSDMPLATDVPGYGFKAAVFDAQRWAFYALLPAAPLGFLMMRIPALYKRLWPIGQHALGVDEFLLNTALLETPRRYAIDWQAERVEFLVDGQSVFSTRRVPSGRLGFVAWIDNQYAIVTPQGKFRFGLVDVPEPQRLVLEDISLTTR
jgi:hypothetical protein